MSLINKAYINAILADASYEISKLKPDYTIQDLFKLLTERMTQSLATYIAENYTVVTYIVSSNGYHQ